MGLRNVIRANEKTLSKNLNGKIYIVTGANSGVGLETTRQLVKQGGHVVMACRRVEAGEKEAQSFAGLEGSYEVMRLDLADLDTVRDFVTNFLKKYSQLDGLVGNAGMVNMSREKKMTKDGLELTMSVSYFGHFLLTELLLDMLKKSAPSRIVLLSSVVHAGNPNNRYDIHLNDLNFQNRPYSNFGAYGEAKLANVLYAMELGERLKSTGVTAYSVHPGWARSNFGGRGLLMRTMRIMMSPISLYASESNEEAAQTSLHCLLSEQALDHSGKYFSQRSILYRDPGTRQGGWPMESPNPNARDINKARKLVEATYKLVGLEK